MKQKMLTVNVVNIGANSNQLTRRINAKLSFVKKLATGKNENVGLTIAKY